MQPLPPYFQKDLSAGMITNINESIRPRNSVALGLNVDFDNELGSAVTRLGTFIVGGQMVAGNSILGLGNYTTPSGTSTLFSAINDTDDATSVIYNQAGDVVQTGLTASKKTRTLTYLGSILVINGADAERAWNGTAWITTGGDFDLANIPSSNTVNICNEFLDRVYVAGDTSNPDRLYYSSVPTAGAVSWTSGNGNVDIEPEDGGGGITALGKVPGYQLIFKNRSMHRWNFTTTFPESLVNIGTPSQECVISQAGICGFFSASSKATKGFYVTNGGRPVPISHLRTKNIAKWVEAIPQSAYSSVAGWGDENHMYWSVGDLTVDRQLYHNVVLRWSIKTGEWCVRTYPTRFTVGTSYLNGEGDVVLVAGTTNGEVIQLDVDQRYNDYTTVSDQVGYTPIAYDIRTYQEKFKFNQKKSISDRIAVYTRNGQGAVPYVIVDGKETFDLESVTSDVHEARLPKTLTGNYYEFGLRGVVQGSQLTFKEFEVPNIQLLNNYA